MILAALACPVFTSCYDDSKLWEEMGSLKDRVTSLEQKLNDELAVFQYILSPDAKLSDVKWDAANGVWKFTLADGTVHEFVQPSAEQYQSFITTVDVDGAKYWATYVNGVATPITDENDKMFPISVTPQVKTDEDGYTYLSLDGENWLQTSANPAIFAGFEVVCTDNYTDEQEAEGWEETPMFVVFTLADGNTITVTLDGAGSFVLGNPYMGGAPEIMYIPAGSTFTQEAMGMNLLDIVVSGPSGWLVEDEIVYEGEGVKQYALNITAPKKSCIEEGHALAGGYLKVIAFFDGGMQTVSKMYVTSEAFQTFSASNGNVVMEPTYGNFLYYYGLVEVGTDLSSTVEMILEYGEELYYADMLPAATNNGWSDDGSRNLPVDELLEGAEYGKTYMLWAYPSSQGDTGYSFAPGNLQTVEFVYQSIAQDEAYVDVTFNSIESKIAFNGVTSLYAGGGVYYDEVPVADDFLSTINMYLDYGYEMMIPRVEAPAEGVFEGNPLELVGESSVVSPNTNYYGWFVIPQDGKKRYTADDVVMYTYSTPAPVAGGSLAVTMTANEVTGANKYKQISVNLASEGAEIIYYAFVEREDVSSIADKAAYLLENGYLLSKDEMAYPVTENNLVPETYKALLAMAVDSEGKYGEVATQVFNTPKYEFNSLKVSVALQGDAIKGYNTFTVTPAEGAAEYRYIFYKTDSYQWTNTYGGSAETAELKIATGTSSTKATLDENNQFQAYANSYGDWVLLVLAKDENGVFSKAAVLNVKVMFNLGTFVAAKDANGNENAEWAAKKPTVTFTTETLGDFTTLSWSVSGLAEGFTAQTVSVHDEYLADYPTGKDKANFFLTSDVIYLEDVLAAEDAHSNYYASAGYNIWVLIKDAEGNYYEPYKYECNITGGFGQ